MNGLSKTAAVLIALGMACSVTAVADDKPKQESKKPPAKSEKLEPFECGNVKRLHTLGGVFLASQPEQGDFKHAKEGGIKTVVNLRKKDEIEWNEEEFVGKLGMEYHSIPFKSPSELTDEVFDNTRKLLNDKSKRPLLLHCSSANRVGAIWLAHRVLDGGLKIEEALEEAKTVGLKLPAFEEKAKDYIERQQKKAAK